MTDHPDFEPLRRVDPSEPDEPEEIGRLEPLDPDADEAPAGSAAALALPETSAATTRPRDGLALAVGLAVLLSLSSIAGIAGLVAISSRSLEPALGLAVPPIEAGVPGPTIRVTEAAQGPEAPGETASEAAGPLGASSGQAVAPATVPSQSGGGGAGAGDGDGQGGGGQGGGGQGGGQGGGGGSVVGTGAGGGSCDAGSGGACDATGGGGVALPTPEDTGGGDSGFDDGAFVRDEDDCWDDLDGDDDDDSSCSGSGSGSGS